MKRAEYRALVTVYLAIWAAFAVGWVVASVLPWVATAMRAHLRLELDHYARPSVAVVVALVTHNTTIAWWPLATIAAGLHRSCVRAVVDVLLAGAAVANAAVVGGAFGAYGGRLIAFLPHLPLEFLGLALPITAWMVRRRPCSADPIGVPWIAALTVGVLAIAALVEAYAT